MGAEAVASVAIDELDERYAALRLPRPRQERAVAESMARLGQLTPLVVCRRDDQHAVVDGLKRLRSARELGLDSLLVRVLPLSEQAAVAAVYSINRQGASGLLDLEEALVVRTLVREHGLAQTEVAELLDRHPSWVSRRIGLLERLVEQVQDDVRVGLVSTTAAREIARLPRGNQPEVAAAVHRAALSSRDARTLVDLFCKASDREQQTALLDRPREAVERQRGGPTPAPWDPRLGATTNRLRRLTASAVGTCQRVTAELADARPATWSEDERGVLGPVLEQLRSHTEGATGAAGAVLDALEPASVQDGA